MGLTEMSMTKKDYELIASVVRANHADCGEKTIAYWLADAFADANPKFDYARFLQACGVEV